ncbi:MAG TPA: AAA family ATPase [Candidatus Paceibacterota bacterium]
MKKIILLAGLPGVGKSTISKKISQEIGAKILDLDDFKRTDVDPTLVKSQIDPPNVRWSYYKKALQHAFCLFRTSNVSAVIMDEVFHLEQLRIKIEVLCAKKNIQVFWVEVKCPYEEVEKRLKAKTREGHILSTDEALKMNLLFQKIFETFPTDIKNHIIVNNNEDNIEIENVLKIIGK